MNHNYNTIHDGIITVMSYEEFADIQDAMEQRRRIRRAKERKNRAIYFHRQRVFGVMVGCAGVFIVFLGCRLDAKIMEIIGAVAGLMGLFLMTTRQMVIVDSYFLECQDRLLNDY